MITYIKNGNLFNHNLDIAVNTVNCVGVMGKGIALQFKERFPDYFRRYKKACQNNEIKPGKCVIHLRETKPHIISFATKDHWRDPSKLEWIGTGLASLRLCLMDTNLIQPLGLSQNIRYEPLVGIPALGCNNGGLDWDKVKPLIENALSDISMRIMVFEPLENKNE